MSVRTRALAVVAAFAVVFAASVPAVGEVVEPTPAPAPVAGVAEGAEPAGPGSEPEVTAAPTAEPTPEVTPEPTPTPTAEVEPTPEASDMPETPAVEVPSVSVTPTLEPTPTPTETLDPMAVVRPSISFKPNKTHAQVNELVKVEWKITGNSAGRIQHLKLQSHFSENSTTTAWTSAPLPIPAGTTSGVFEFRVPNIGSSVGFDVSVKAGNDPTVYSGHSGISITNFNKSAFSGRVSLSIGSGPFGLAQYANGVLLKNRWIDGGGKWYYASSSGLFHQGWLFDRGSWYQLDRGTFAMITNQVWADYNVDPDRRFYFGPDGVMRTGWFQRPGYGSDWHWADQNGVMFRGGWLQQGGKWYHFRSSYLSPLDIGSFQTDDGKYYVANLDGSLATGGWVHTRAPWRTDILSWYYTKPSGEPIGAGWQRIGGSWYVFEPEGSLYLGWLKLAEKWYYLNPTSGIMTTGWAHIKDSKTDAWRYFSAAGQMQFGWLQQGGKWYYLKSGNGAMTVGEYVIAGKKHRFDKNGVWLGEVK